MLSESLKVNIYLTTDVMKKQGLFPASFFVMFCVLFAYNQDRGEHSEMQERDIELAYITRIRKK